MIKLKRLNYVTLIIILILTVNLFGCTNSIATNINGIDDKNIIKTIDADGYHEDSCGYKFDRYNKSAHFEIYYNSLNSSDEEYVNSSILRLENSYSNILSFFNVDEKDMPIVKIYLYGEDEVALHNIFEKDLENSYEGLVGRYVKSNSIYAVNKTNLVYDFTDCVILTFDGSEKIPEWLLEGTASYLTEDEDGYINYYANFAEYETIDFYELENENKQGYVYGYSLVSSIVEKYGEDKLKKLIKSYGDIEITLGITNDELFDLWKEYVESNSLENVYGFDETDVISLIDKNGYYEDEGGNIFDSYAKSDHFEIYYDSKSYNSEKRANRTINHLEENYDKIINIFDISEAHIPVIKINMYSQYDKYVKFCKAKNYTTAIQSVATAPLGNRIYILFDNDVDAEENGNEMNNRLTAALHEFIHNVHINKTGKKYIPHWLMDGVAMYYSQQSDMYGKTHYSKMLEEEFPSIEDLTVYTGDNFWTPYMYGYTMIEYILQEYGEEKLLEVITEYGDIEEVLEISYEEFAQAWKKYLKTK